MTSNYIGFILYWFKNYYNKKSYEDFISHLCIIDISLIPQNKIPSPEFFHLNRLNNKCIIVKL